jgi:hypothetical protein
MVKFVECNAYEFHSMEIRSQLVAFFRAVGSGNLLRCCRLLPSRPGFVSFISENTKFKAAEYIKIEIHILENNLVYIRSF